MGLVVEYPPGPDEDFPVGEATTNWNLVDLALQRQSARGGFDPDKPHLHPPPPALKTPPKSPAIALPTVTIDGAISLRAVLESRRTIRRYSDSDLSVDEVAAFLYSTARVVQVAEDPVVGQFSKRPYPSGGGRHALEIYLIVNAVTGLSPGAYYYHPGNHTLHLLKPPDEGQAELNQEVRAAATNAAHRDPPLVLLITAVFQRSMWKYERIALSTILKDLGGLYQTMYLVATAMGLAPCALGAGRESDNARWLGLDPLVESQVGCFLLGRPPLPKSAAGSAGQSFEA